MTLKRYTVAICLMAMFLFPYFSSGQKYVVKQSDAVLDDYLHEIFPVPSGYLVVNYASPHGAFSYKRKEKGFVNGYNASLKQTFTTPFSLEGKDYTAGFSVDGKIYIFAMGEDRNIYRMTLDAAKGSAIGATEKMFSVPGENTKTFKGCSADSSLYYLLFRDHEKGEKTESLHGVVMDRQMNTITRLSATFEEQPDEIGKLECVLANDGTLSVVTPSKNKTSKGEYMPLKYSIKQFDKAGKPTTTLLYNLPEGLLTNTSWEANAAGLSFTGLLSPGKKAGYTSIVSGTFDNKQRKLVDIKKLEIAQTSFALQTAEPYMKEITKEGIPKEAVLSADFTFEDQSRVLILEIREDEFHDHYGSYLASGGAWGPQSRFSSHMNYETGNVYVVKLNAHNEMQWLKCVRKKQIEPSVRNYTGIVALKDDKERVHIIFHDNRLNKEVLPRNPASTILEGGDLNGINIAAITVDKEGTIKKEFIAEDRGLEHFFSPNRSVVSNNKVVYSAYRQRNGGKSTYTLGSVVITD